MDRQIRRLGMVVVVLFVVLFAQVNYIQVFAASDLVNNQANSYRRIVQEYDVDRGPILARDGETVLAMSKQTGGTLKYVRRYPDGELYGNVTGFYSLVYGTTDLERTFNDELSARDESLLPQTLLDQILGKPKRGAAVVTTIDPDLQRVATKALGKTPGALVAMDPGTGDILAMVSVPSYDPNLLSSHNPKEIRAAWSRYNRDKQKPLVSKANQELYPPGSSFKIVTAAAALENGFGPDSQWENPPELPLPQTTHTLSNFGGEHCLGGASSLTLSQALTVSCNVVFGEIGLELGAKKLTEQARRFGFGQDIPFDVPFEEGRFPDASYFDERAPALALSAIGQDEVATNPLQMALVASAIADKGVEMKPRLVSEIRDPEGRTIETFAPEAWGQPISGKTASDLTKMMVSVVNDGTGTAAQIPGVQVAGKTGTAQHGEGEPPHAWFVSFAPAENPQVAVAVVVLNGGDLGSEATGGQVAAPIAKRVIEAAVK